ncbi:MAG: hypothetical protein ACK5AZ_20175 [Bryobacteraceae bacterium]
MTTRLSTRRQLLLVLLQAFDLVTLFVAGSSIILSLVVAIENPPHGRGGMVLLLLYY